VAASHSDKVRSKYPVYIIPPAAQFFQSDIIVYERTSIVLCAVQVFAASFLFDGVLLIIILNTRVIRNN
jgi:hypothetical protein